MSTSFHCRPKTSPARRPSIVRIQKSVCHGSSAIARIRCSWSTVKCGASCRSPRGGRRSLLTSLDELLEGGYAAWTVIKAVDPGQNGVHAALCQAFGRQLTLTAENYFSPDTSRIAVYPDHVFPIPTDPLVFALADQIHASLL